MARPKVIAVDGPAASGKGTLARRLARRLGYAYLDTGLLYRATALALLQAGRSPEDADAATAAAASVGLDDLAAPELRSEEVSAASGVVAAIPGVRAALLALQRDFAVRPPEGAPGAVLDGRDIGTVVCPAADAKIFLTAAPEVRAERRLKELLERGIESIPPRVLQDMQERDARDRGRDLAPLKAASDALLLDTTHLSADQVFERALAFVMSRNAS